MRKNLLSIIFTISFAVLMSSSVFASPMPPMPECKIKAEVIENNIIHNPYSPLAKKQGIAKSTPEWTIIKIMETDERPVVDSPYSNENYCKEQYVKGEEITLRLEEKYKKGTIIKGIISVHGDEWSVGHSLENIEKILNNDTIDDNQKNIINNDDSSIFYIFEFSATIVILLIILWFFLIKRRQK